MMTMAKSMKAAMRPIGLFRNAMMLKGTTFCKRRTKDATHDQEASDIHAIGHIRQSSGLPASTHRHMQNNTHWCRLLDDPETPHIAAETQQMHVADSHQSTRLAPPVCGSAQAASARAPLYMSPALRHPVPRPPGPVDKAEPHAGM